MNIYVPTFMKILLFQAYCKQNIRLKWTIPEFQPPLFMSGKLDFELSYHVIFSEKFEGERFANRKWKGQQNYRWKKHSKRNEKYG